jgi:hypothetical protein
MRVVRTDPHTHTGSLRCFLFNLDPGRWQVKDKAADQDEQDCLDLDNRESETAAKKIRRQWFRYFSEVPRYVHACSRSACRMEKYQSMGLLKTTSGRLTQERHHVTVDTGNRVGGSHLLLAINPPFRSDQERYMSVDAFTKEAFSYLKDSASGPQSSVAVFKFKMAEYMTSTIGAQNPPPRTYKSEWPSSSGW